MFPAVMAKTQISATGRLTEAATQPCPVMLAAAGAGRRTAASGFSLLEILVVLFIIGIVVSVTGLGLGRSARANAMEEAQLLYRVARLAHEEAVLFRKQLGIEFKSEDREDSLPQYSYRWLQYNRDSETWRPFSDNRSGFAARKMQPGLVLELEAEEDAVRLEQKEEDLWQEQDADAEEESRWPQLMFLSSGEITPFTITLSVADEFDSLEPVVRLKGNLYAEMEIERSDSDE